MDISYSMLGIIAIVLFICIGISFIVNQFLLKNASSFGKNKGGAQVRWAAAAKPPVGGMSFYVVLIGAILGLLLSFNANISWSFVSLFIGIVLPVTVGFFVGLADDSYNTSPLIKFIGQFSCAGLFILAGVVIPISDNNILNYWFTVTWVVGMMNSINMLDNMDGIVSSVSLVSLGLALMVIFSSKNQNLTDIIIITAVIGALIGFLFFNWNPAKIYMGDTGSQFLGAFLSWVSIQYFWQFRDFEEGGIQVKQFLIPALAFIIPLMDTVTVTLRRLARGVSPFVGGRDHTTHHLAYLGIKDKNVVRIMIAISIVSALGAINILPILKSMEWHWSFSLATIIYYLSVFFGLQYFYEVAKQKIRQPKHEERNERIRVEGYDEVLN
jgi:UDP-GlcNAc:undecaprenyl-phosphate/decaprenyl-phosphate GlcNAc-1-phosphate transferase